MLRQINRPLTLVLPVISFPTVALKERKGQIDVLKAPKIHQRTN